MFILRPQLNAIRLVGGMLIIIGAALVALDHTEAMAYVGMVLGLLFVTTMAPYTVARSMRLHYKVTKDGGQMHQSRERAQGREAERQADRFAAAFLMPRADILAHNLRNASPDQLIEASRRWRVSAMALAHRLSELGLLTEWGYRSACVAGRTT